MTTNNITNSNSINTDLINSNLVLNSLPNNELQALASLLDEEDKEILAVIEKQIYALGVQMIPFLEIEQIKLQKNREENQQENQQENRNREIIQTRIQKILSHLQYDLLFERLKIWKETEQEDLLKGLWIIATYQYPNLNLQSLKITVEQLYYEVWQVLRDDLHPYDQVKIMNSIVFGKLRFKVNTDFQAIDNSMINKVLDTKLGNPIGLCCVYLLIAEKLKLPIYGVNLPNIFVVTYQTNIHHFYINVSNKGVILNRADLDNYIEQLSIPPSDSYYQPCKNIDILKRILRNLGYAFEKHEQLADMKVIKKLLEILTV